LGWGTELWESGWKLPFIANFNDTDCILIEAANAIRDYLASTKPPGWSAVM